MRALSVVVAALVVVSVAAVAAWRLWPEALDFDVEDAEVSVPKLFGPSPRPARTIFLERGGATLTGGEDDAARNVSSVVGAKKPKATLPPFRGSASAWRKLVTCLRDTFAPYDVDIVERRPDGRGYALVVVGGKPSALGYGAKVSGLAPFNGLPIEDPVVFVFSEAVRHDPRVMCETAAMEVAHAYGLDHEYLCKDPMTYLRPCGTKRFQDVDAPCGELKKRTCADGRPTQNSHARLLAVLGPRRTAAR